jgi:hypothetical protein
VAVAPRLRPKCRRSQAYQRVIASTGTGPAGRGRQSAPASKLPVIGSTDAGSVGPPEQQMHAIDLRPVGLAFPGFSRRGRIGA